MPRRSYHHGDLRRALLDAALALIDERGPDRFTMAEAARRAGVSSGAPYRHFADRAALLAALAAEGQALLQGEIAAASAGAGSPGEVFRLTGVAYVRFAAEHPSYFQVMSAPERVASLQQSDPAEAAYWAALAQWIAASPADEPLDPADPLVVQLAGRALAHGLATLFTAGHMAQLGVGVERAGQVAQAVTQGVVLLGGPPPRSAGEE